MRRDELSSQDPALFNTLASECIEGYLSLITASGFPRGLALNFAAMGQMIYFHGALAGEKFELIKAGPPVGFSMVQPLSVLPSHWFSPTSACPATHLFRSVEIKGHCRLVEDLDEKARALQALMEKYQPDGGFKPITASDKLYRKALESVGVFRVAPESWTGKVKLLQEDNEKGVLNIMKLLRERGTEVDLLTVQLMGEVQQD